MSEHEKASGKESPRWQRIAAAPSGFELWLLGIWIGTYLIVGSNSTIPSPVDAVGSRSLLNVLALSWEFVPGVFLLALLIRVALIAGFDLRGEAQIAFDRWISAAVIGIFIAVLVGTHLDLAARVRLSDAALMDEVEAIRRLPEEDEAHLRNRPVGLFTVYYSQRKEKIVWLTTVKFGRPFSAGLVFSPNGEPPRQVESEYQHLYGPWWRWLQDI